MAVGTKIRLPEGAMEAALKLHPQIVRWGFVKKDSRRSDYIAWTAAMRFVLYVGGDVTKERIKTYWPFLSRKAKYRNRTEIRETLKLLKK